MATNDASTILDLYKTAVEMADRTSARRAGANSFFLTLTTGLAAVVGIVSSARPPRSQDTAGSLDAFGLLAAAVAGAVLSLVWWLLLRYYRRLNRAKFDVIIKLEQRLPVQLFTDEWAILHPAPPTAGEGHPAWTRWWRREVKHREATVVEQVIPFVFVGIYLALGLGVLVQ